jgi:hypothetical protein
MGKIVAWVVVLALGLTLGFWLAVPTGPRAPAGVGQTLEHVRAAAQQLRANAEAKIQAARSPSFRSGPGLLERITAPFAAFANSVAQFWSNIGKSIRPPALPHP